MIIKESYIRQISENKWRVFSEKGKNLGTFPSRSKAEKRLKQIEMFKHMKPKNKKSSRIEDWVKICGALDVSFYKESKDHNKKEPKSHLNYSHVMRKLRKSETSETIKKFQKIFKQKFEQALSDELTNPENIALMAAMKAVDFKE